VCWQPAAARAARCCALRARASLPARRSDAAAAAAAPS
jgi:hypothetical protein